MIYNLFNNQRAFQRVTELPSAPVNASPPVVTGTGYIGYVLSTTDGLWAGSPAPSFTYQWQRNGIDIPLATANTYTVTLADEGEAITCIVTATNSEGSTPATSNAIEQWVLADVAAVGAVLENWFDAEDLSTITIATGISAWTGKGTLNDVVANANASQQPTYQLSGYNGRPCAFFDNALSQRLVTSAVKARLFNRQFAIIAAALHPNNTASTKTLCLISTPSGGDLRMSSRMIPNNIQVQARNPDAGSVASSGALSASTLAPETQQYVWDVAAAVGATRVNGVEVSAGGFSTAGSTPATDSARLNLGASGGGTANFMSGCLHELAVISGVSAVTLKDKIDGYLAWRGRTVAALSAGNPYKLAPPTP